MTSWMTLVDPKDHILKVLCHYLYFWLRYMGVNKAYNQRPVYSHVTKYWPLIGRNFNPRYWGGAKGLAIFFLHQSIPEVPLIDFLKENQTGLELFFLSDKLMVLATIQNIK